MKDFFEMLERKRSIINKLRMSDEISSLPEFQKGMLAGMQQLACWLLEPDNFMEPIFTATGIRDAELRVHQSNGDGTSEAANDESTTEIVE